jgi:hypothetical protein
MTKMMRRLLPLFCLTIALMGLSACVYVPPPGYAYAPDYSYYPGYAYAPGYSYPYYPPVVGSVDLGFGFGGGWHHRHWR